VSTPRALSARRRGLSAPISAPAKLTVEVVHLHVALGSDGVGPRARVLGELARPQHPHLLDTLHRRGTQIRRELLVAEDRQALPHTGRNVTWRGGVAQIDGTLLVVEDKGKGRKVS
jgi:hypothetical protein